MFIYPFCIPAESENFRFGSSVDLGAGSFQTPRRLVLQYFSCSRSILVFVPADSILAVAIFTRLSLLSGLRTGFSLPALGSFSR
jgi:hypothetical protein